MTHLQCPGKRYSYAVHCESTLYGNLIGAARGRALSVATERVECLASHQGVSVQCGEGIGTVTQNLGYMPAFDKQELARETLPWCLCAQATGEEPSAQPPGPSGWTHEHYDSGGKETQRQGKAPRARRQASIPASLHRPEHSFLGGRYIDHTSLDKQLGSQDLSQGEWMSQWPVPELMVPMYRGVQ